MVNMTKRGPRNGPYFAARFRDFADTWNYGQVELNDCRCEHWECSIDGVDAWDGCRNGGTAALIRRGRT